MTKKPDTAKIPFELFHSYLVDSRGELVEKSKSTIFKEDNRLRFFTSDMGDPSRTNADACGYMGNDDSFVIHSIRIGIKLSNREHLPDFLRATRFMLEVGNKPYSPIESNLLADLDSVHGVSYQKYPVNPTEFEVDLWAEKQLERQIHIPSRQCFHVEMETYNIFSNRMREIEEGKVKEFAEIKVTLCGKRITHSSVTIEEMIEASEPNQEESAEENPENTPYRGHGTPQQDEDPLAAFCSKLFNCLKTTGHSDHTIESVQAALLLTMANFPTYWSRIGEFTIPAQSSKQEQKVEFFVEDRESGEKKKWDPTEYLKNKKK